MRQKTGRIKSAPTVFLINLPKTVGNGLDRSAKSLPRGEGGFFGFAEKDERGITKFPEGKASLA